MRYALVLFLMLLVTACPKKKGEERDGGTGPDRFDGDAEVTVLLTDAPDDLVHAWVIVREIYLLGGDNRDQRFALYGGPSAWIDLLAIGTGTLELARATVPAGQYGQLLIRVDAAAIQTEDGRLYATEGADPPGDATPDGLLTCVTCAVADVRVTTAGRNLTIDEPRETFVLDFEVDESFTFPENRPESWSLRPVVRLYGSAAEAD